MSLEFRKNDVKSKATEIYTLLHTHSMDSVNYVGIDKINYHLSQVLKIIEGGK